MELAELRQDSLEQSDLRRTRAGDHGLRHAVRDRFHLLLDLLLPGPSLREFLLQGLDLIIQRHLADREGAEVPLAPRGIGLGRHQSPQHALHQHKLRPKVDHHALPLAVVLPRLVSGHFAEDVQDELVLRLGRVLEPPFEHGLLSFFIRDLISFNLGVEGLDLGLSTRNFSLFGQAILLDGVELPGLEARKQLNSPESQNNAQQFLAVHVVLQEYNFSS
mmetsp:Transcript_24330/g.68403  ORF Transcript_24330/g.68403 Transcript_24330/m.68403 type:complete len:219 (-) Transcript_24330:713-1369(-)